MPEATGVIAGLLTELAKLPGVGPKSAERIAHHLLAGDRRAAAALADALRAVVERVRPYHVLGGRLAPLDGVGPDQLALAPLARRVRAGGVREVILATSPTLEGDGTALFAANLLAGTGVAVTKLARGLPTGSSLELANAQMLADALDGRRTV